MPNPDYVGTTYVITPTPAGDQDINILDTVYLDNATGATVDSNIMNTSIPITQASTLNVSINSGASTIPEFRDTTQYSFKSVSANAALAVNRQTLVAEYPSRVLYIQGVEVSNGATAGDVLVECYSGGSYTVKIQKMYLAEYGAATLNFATPIVLPAGAGLSFTSTTVTDHSITVKYYY